MGYLYFLYDNGGIVYVGYTANLKARLSMHRKDKTFSKIKYFEMDSYSAKNVESFLIGFLKPKYNSRIDWNRLELREYIDAPVEQPEEVYEILGALYKE